MAVEQINLYRFVCEGDHCKQEIVLGREPTKSPAMPGLDEGEACALLEPIGWYVPQTDAFDLDEILCPACANDQAAQADREFDARLGFKNAANQPDDPAYDPDERRVFNQLTIAERRTLHPSRLGRVATVDDARRLIAERETN